MNPKLRSVLVAIGIITLVIIAIILIPRGSSVYYQARGGQQIEYVLRNTEGIDELVCKQLSANDEITLKEVNKGIEDLNRAIELNKNNSQAYSYLGKAHCLLGEFEEAKENYLQYLQLRPENPIGYVGLGFVYEKLDDPSSAREAWNMAGITPSQFTQNSIQSYQENKITEALRWLFRASEMGEDVRSSVHYFRSLQAIQSNDPVKGQAMLELAVKENNGWVNPEIEFNAWFSWGKILLEQERNKKAEDAISYSINLDPKGVPSYDLSEAYRFLGLSQWAQEEYTIARINFERAIEVNNNNPWAHIHYGKLLWILDQNLISEIQDEFNIAFEIAPLSPTVWESAIRFWIENNHSDKAEQLCQQADNRGMNSIDLPSCEVFENG